MGRGYLPAKWRLVRNAVLVDLVILVAVGLVCWLADWRTLLQFGQGLVWAGVGAMIVGVSSLTGFWSATRRYPYQHSESAGVQSIHERARQAVKDEAQNFGFLILMGVAGVVSILVGALIQTVVG